MLTERDILLIQNKVDGMLSHREEDQFAALLEASPQAVDLYRKLLAVHEEMYSSAARIPEIDITKQVMRRIEGKTFLHKLFTGSGRVYAFAAALVLFFVLGMLAATYLVPSLRNLSQEELAGAMMRKKTTLWSFHDTGIDIEVQQQQEGDLVIYRASVFTADSLNVEFSSPGEPVNVNLLKIIDFDGLAQKMENTDHKISYICQGNTVFTLTDPPDRSSLTFSLEGKQAFHMKFPPTF